MDLSNEPKLRHVIPGYPNYFLTPDGVWSYWENRQGGRPWYELKERNGYYELFNPEGPVRAKATRAQIEAAVERMVPLPGTPVVKKERLSEKVTRLEARVKALEERLNIL